MDIERTMEFIVEQQAKNQALLEELLSARKRIEATQERTEATQERTARQLEESARQLEQSRVLAERRARRIEHTVALLARHGVWSRSRINDRIAEHERRLHEHEQWFADQKLLMHEIGEKLNALIDVVDRWPRNQA